MKRNEVYNHINIERDYQDLKWDGRKEKNDVLDIEKPISEWVNYIEYHIQKAKENIYYLNEEEALAEIRKVTALAVKCIEIHGCPKRIIPKKLIKENLK